MKRLVKKRSLKIVLPLLAMVAAGAIGAYTLLRSHAETTSASDTPPVCADFLDAQPFPTLVRHSTGTCVGLLQWTLNHLQYNNNQGTISKNYGLDITGNYDVKTFIAVTDFQRRLTAFKCKAAIGEQAPEAPAIDGTVEPVTWYFLTTLSSQPGYSGASYTCDPGNPLL